MANFIYYLVRVWEKLGELIHYPLVWLSGLGIFIIDAIVGGRIIIYMVIVASVIDLFCGIAVAISKKEFTRSELMRQTVEKLTIYALCLLTFFCVDAAIEQEVGFQTDVTSGLVGVIITLTEAWSFLASLLILFPNNPILRLMQKSLTGEIARKLGCEDADVEKILNGARRKKMQKRGKNGRYISNK